jgi:hypothetical protein
MNSTKIRAIVTGVTGMVGEGVLHECLESDAVEAVLIINRKPSGISHPKLKEIIHSDFFNLSPIASQLTGYNACYFCLGVSSIGMKEPEYRKVTYDLTLQFAETLAQQNPEMTFCYVSGAGTDSTEKGSSMWARVKGKTENDLMKLPFRQVFAFRPGYIHPTPGLKNVLPFVKYVSWLFPIFKVILPNTVSTLAQVGQAMIKVTQFGYDKKILEVKDIKIVADRQYV